jgi:hypothetical protein
MTGKFNGWKGFKRIEVKANLGLLILAGVLPENHEPLRQLWNDTWGRPMFKAPAHEKRFSQFLRLTRSNDSNTRDERRDTTLTNWLLFAQLPIC